MKQHPKNKQQITDEHIALAQSFIKSEIKLKQLNTALGFPTRSTRGYITVARALREAYNKTKPAPLPPPTGEELNDML